MQNQPLFTSASGQSHLGQDDFDLGEVFAEYFSNEFDSDPMNAYTNSMANYSYNGNLPSAAAVHAAALQGQVAYHNLHSSLNGGTSAAGADGANSTTNLSLPTGGIKTAFHIGTNLSTRPPGVIVPPQKRAKSEESHQEQQQHQAALASSSNNTLEALAHQQQRQQQAAQVPSSNDALGALVLAHQQAQAQHNFAVQLAVSGGIPHQQHQQQQQPQQQQQQHIAVPTAVTSSNGDAGAVSRVALPVGVGIRLGGLGGIAPATAQQANRPTPVVMPTQYASLSTLWGGGGGEGQIPSPFNLLPGQNQEVAVAERRLRNREHAKRSRVRKKFMLESMQEQVRSLQIENLNLRLLIQEHIPEHATSIIAECCTASPLFSDSLGLDGDDDGSTKLGKMDFSLMESLASGQRCFVLSDPRLPDNPIVFASGDFYKLTGYVPKEVLGRNCRFLQGPGTDPRAIEVIRKAIATGTDATVCLLNYKADGTPFWNQFFIAALRDSDNCIVNYVGVQCEVEAEQGDTTVEEKVNEVLPLQSKNDYDYDDEDD